MLLGAVAIAAGLEHALRRVVPSVARVAVPTGGCGRTSAVISLGPHNPGEPARVISAAFEAVSLIKQVTVVDDDIRVDDSEHVAWAMTTRMRAERDLTLLPGRRADRAELLERERTVTKLGIDATRRVSDRDQRLATPPADVVQRMRRLLDR